MGMDWKSAMKALKAFHAPGLDGSPASMQKELDGLEESLKGWEDRDESRAQSFAAWQKVDATIRAERDAALLQVDVMRKALRKIAYAEESEHDTWCEKIAGIAYCACDVRIAVLALANVAGRKMDTGWAICGWCAGTGKEEKSATMCPKCNGAGGRYTEKPKSESVEVHCPGCGSTAMCACGTRDKLISMEKRKEGS